MNKLFEYVFTVFNVNMEYGNQIILSRIVAVERTVASCEQVIRC